MDITIIISIGALLVAFLGFVLNSRKETRTDAATNAVTQTKLDNLINGVTDIRVEVRSMRESINDHSERLARVEARAESNTHRLDTIDGKKVEKND